jgi:periplasmic protein CpxP/Spy
MESKNLKFWKAFAIILLALNLILIAFLLLKPMADHHRMQREEGGPGHFLVQKLKFNAAQETAFDKLRMAHHDSIEILMVEGKKLRKSFFDGLITNANDSTKLKMAEQIADNQKQIELLTYNHFVEVKKLCTPEQMGVFNDIIQEVIQNLQGPPMRPPDPK